VAKSKFSKKVSRNYRVSTLFDLIVKRGAKIFGSSEADFVELCVLGEAESVIFKRRALEKIAVSGEDRELSEWITEASKQLHDRLNNFKKDTHA